MRIAVMIACAVLAALLAVTSASADKRVALVIGNSAYTVVPGLRNPKNDAEDVAKALRGLNFEVIVGTDLNRAGMNEKLLEFSRATDRADIAFVYYAGHGMQFAGVNYLLPIDVRLASVQDVNRFQLVPLNDVLETLSTVKGARVVVLDACRNNPVEEELKRRLAMQPGANRDAILSRGLGRVSINGLLVAYATQANDVASDGNERNSPFTTAFIKHVGESDVDIRQMFYLVQDEVDKLTGSRQRPELSISLVGQYKLKITATSVAPSTSAPPVVQAPTADAAERAWILAKDTTSQAVLEDFIRRYGDTFFGTLARARLEELKKSQTALSPPALTPGQIQSTAKFSLGTWSVSFNFGSGNYTGNLQVTSMTGPNQYQGEMTVKTISGQTVRQRASISVDGKNVKIICTVIEYTGGTYNPDSFELVLSEKSMDGSVKDTKGLSGVAKFILM